MLQCDGNLFDACSIAALAALHSSAIPSVEVSVDPSSNELMLEVDDDQSNATNLDLTNAALLVSVHSIGGWSVFDTTLEEQVHEQRARARAKQSQSQRVPETQYQRATQPAPDTERQRD